MTAVRVLVLGASGRLGGMLRRHWPGRADLAPLWQMRRPLPGALCFSPLEDRPDLGPLDAVLGLAGITPQTGAALDLNTDLALTAVDLAARHGARRVFLSSSASAYAPGPDALAEDDRNPPPSAYGRAKRAMEGAALARAQALGVAATVLRIGNVAGADALMAAPPGPKLLDRFPDGRGPRRSYVAPQDLAAILGDLVGLATPLPEVLNIALPGAVAMEDLLTEAALPFDWRPAPPEAIPSLVLDVSRLLALMPLPPADPARIVAGWREDRRMP